ncbi:MAG: hypothetical protein IKZ14_04970 [Muribaculaceae bacterium]|nr:hypothetical protein [Muribaculaceae bacterium]
MKKKVFGFSVMMSLVFAVAFLSCGDKSCGKMPIARLDKVVCGYVDAETVERENIKAEYGDAIDVWCRLMGYESADDSVLMQMSQSRAMEVFAPDVRERFTAIDSISEVLFSLEENVGKILKDSVERKYYSVISPYTQSVYLADLMVFVALNHYLGSDYKGYGYFEQYQRVTKTPQHLPYDVAEAIISTRFPFEASESSTVLNALLYNGAVLATIEAIVPDAHIAEAMGYSAEQMEWLDQNEPMAWDAIITKRLLYSSSLGDVDRLTRPAPSTTIVHQQSPGRLGRYIGYKIVKSFIKNNGECDYVKLLQPSFYNDNQSLILSGYNGGK